MRKIQLEQTNKIPAMERDVTVAKGSSVSRPSPKLSDRARTTVDKAEVISSSKTDEEGFFNFLDHGDASAVTRSFSSVDGEKAAPHADDQASFFKMRSFAASFMFGNRKVRDADRDLLQHFIQRWSALEQKNPEVAKSLGFGNGFGKFVQDVANLLKGPTDAALVIVGRNPRPDRLQ